MQTVFEKETGRVIVTYGRSMMALVIAHSLGRRGIEVIGCDDVELTVLNFSRYVKNNFVHIPQDPDPEAFVNDLAKKCERYVPDDGKPFVLMPVFRETEVLAKHKHLFSKTLKLAAPPFPAIQMVHPKNRLFMTATENGVSIPSTFQPANMDELESLATNISFPVILKPIDDVGGRGIVKVANIQQLKNEYLKSYKKYQTAPLIQNFVDGDDYCLTVLYEDGKLVSSMAYKNIHRFPKEAGAGSFRETVDDKPFLAVANSLLEPIGWHGIAELDFRWNGNPGSIPFLIEVNPRFWAGLFQSVASGIDYPYALYHMTIYGKAPFLPSPAIGHKTKIPGLWLISAVQGIAQSEKNYEELAYTWKNIQGSIKNKQLKESFKIVQQMLGNKKIEFSKLISVLRSIIADGRMATNDIFFRDDPFVVLGVLFILASLLRHRKLPPEILH